VTPVPDSYSSIVLSITARVSPGERCGDHVTYSVIASMAGAPTFACS